MCVWLVDKVRRRWKCYCQNVRPVVVQVVPRRGHEDRACRECRPFRRRVVPARRRRQRNLATLIVQVQGVVQGLKAAHPWDKLFAVGIRRFAHGAVERLGHVLRQWPRRRAVRRQQQHKGNGRPHSSHRAALSSTRPRDPGLKPRHAHCCPPHRIGPH